MQGWLRLVIAFVVLGHGIAYLPYAFVPGQVVKAWKGSSQLMGSVLAADRVGAAAHALFITAGFAMVAVAVAIAFAPWIPGWWRPLAIVGSLAGLAGFAAFWDGQRALLVEEGVIGVAISLILLGVAVALPAAFG
jgi:hypothetical protein